MVRKQPVIQAVLTGGLGNQMFQYAVARQLAWRSGCELKLIPSPDGPAGSHMIYRLKHFNIVGRDLSRDEITGTNISRYNRAVKWLIPGLRAAPPIKIIQEKLIFDFIADQKAGRLRAGSHFLFDPELTQPQKNVRLSGYWQNEKYFSGIAPIIKAEFTLKDILDPRSLTCLQEIKSRPSVFLHVRRGDYLDAELTDLFGICPASYYENGLALLRERHGDDLKVFVFSNDFGWVTDNKIGGGDAVLVDWNETAPQNDLMLMRACQHAVIANSSFSWWGAWLGEWPGQTVIAPRIWFKSVPEYHDIVPDRWVRL